MACSDLFLYTGA